MSRLIHLLQGFFRLGKVKVVITLGLPFVALISGMLGFACGDGMQDSNPMRCNFIYFVFSAFGIGIVPLINLMKYVFPLEGKVAYFVYYIAALPWCYVVSCLFVEGFIKIQSIFKKRSI